ncbi:hypothetical protein CBR_g48800 [Chara braunii]|uniref:Translocon-associated protein subunit beta n=1 Tax=Chara braunii TaxID=69332 RepID=A0A388M3D2_CHABU|nr:hypothetical protein CBR_g48800 [Chara braunii]|eukprot:GBG89090.1 hypothetical protein CBR_g48800 [Chara braunii]
MDRQQRVLLVALWGSLLLLSVSVAAAAAAGAQNSAFLVVDKRVTLKRMKDAEKVTVSFGIHNMGGGIAYDVTLTDSEWPESSFELLSGNISTSWVQLEGGAVVEHSFVLKTTTKGPFVTLPATVTYRLASKSTPQTAKSTPVPTLDLLGDREPEVLVDIKTLVINAAPLTSAIAIVAGVIYIIFAPSRPTSKYSAGSKKRR